MRRALPASVLGKQLEDVPGLEPASVHGALREIHDEAAEPEQLIQWWHGERFADHDQPAERLQSNVVPVRIDHTDAVARPHEPLRQPPRIGISSPPGLRIP
jgi:hypothetical protein